MCVWGDLGGRCGGLLGPHRGGHRGWRSYHNGKQAPPLHNPTSLLILLSCQMAHIQTPSGGNGAHTTEHNFCFPHTHVRRHTHAHTHTRTRTCTHSENIFSGRAVCIQFQTAHQPQVTCFLSPEQKSVSFSFKVLHRMCGWLIHRRYQQGSCCHGNVSPYGCRDT